MSSHFGIDLLFETQKEKINSENDVLIIVIHWILCKNKFRSVGVGDNKIYSDEDRPTELLPQGWNDNQKAYTLRYVLDKNIFILYGIVSDETIIINLLDGKTLKTASLVLNPKEVIKAKSGIAIEDFVNDSNAVIEKITDQLVKPLISSETAKSATPGPSTNRDPLLIRRVNPPPHSGIVDPRTIDPLRDIGRGDLDPFGRGGGMLFQPDFRHEFGPRNPINPNAPLRIPPGARYDPPNPFGRLDPDNDHIRPPGYDDMFM
ncbi:hypothetical protein PVAND_010350 [Polypedilum vanderplanki]|uniref:Proteasome inhibitor PI31 subunit n=1 Tax=Polypedilum vanderplanki TaxID=319348 RepID=A0A9J6CFZ7_POLVA|nr:hypothetical protein PVAND_010350 [Polypedilum vanderplanki]